MSASCAGSGRSDSAQARRATDEPLEIRADWDDAEAAARVALGQVGIASLRVDRSEPGRLAYSLLTAYDEPGTLVLERRAPEGEPDPVLIAVDCTIGRFGDADRERELVSRVADRLEQLRGVEVAPIRD